jgi:stress response protein SCP2
VAGLSVNLQKGQKVDLTKGNAGISSIMVGLGWDPVNQPASSKPAGIFGSLLRGGGGGGGTQIDCDASVVMLNANAKLTDKGNLIYYGNLKSKDGSVQHMGDNLTGQGEGDDEQIFVELSKIPQDIQRLVFVVNIYDCEKRKQDFGMIQNAFIRIVDTKSKKELLKFNLSENYAGKTALIAGEVYRHQGEWKFSAMGEATRDGSLSELIKRYA